LIYIDTNIIISFVDEADPNHEKAVKLLSASKGKGKRVVSRLVLLELASVYSRSKLRNLAHPVALALYSIEQVQASILELDFNLVIEKALNYAEALRLRTLDLLHLTAAKMLGANYFLTLDKGIAARSNEAKQLLGIEIITA